LFCSVLSHKTYHQQRVNSTEQKLPEYGGGEAAALALPGGAVALATSILLLEDRIDDSNQDGVTEEDILTLVNVAR
jgi:hypothetical protein